MRIPYIAAPFDVEAVFAGLPARAVACCNWPDEYPERPEVSFRIFHDDANLYIRYDVDEACMAAATLADNGPVWLDSCAEFFIAPDAGGYYNFELNCVGALLIGYRDTAGNVEHADAATLATVSRSMSLPRRELAPTRPGRWTATLTIPARALFRHSLTSFAGLRARANVYKCGDNLPTPHFLSWAPINYPTPNFHLPAFFADIEFGTIAEG